jgi:phosphate transport system protein
MPEQSEHIVRSFEEQLKKLREMIARMGGLAERQVADAAYALVRRDTELASEVIGRDGEIDALERDIENFCVRLLALRQPMAGDLRFIIAAMKVSNAIERIGDYARNCAKRAVVISQQPQISSMTGFQWMAKLVQENLKEAIDSLLNQDAAAAERVWAADANVDEVPTPTLPGTPGTRRRGRTPTRRSCPSHRHGTPGQSPRSAASAHGSARRSWDRSTS